jgi:hypothetical protein
MDSYDDYGAYYDEDAEYHDGDLNISARSSSPPPPPPPPAFDESIPNRRDVPILAKSTLPSAGFEDIFPPKQQSSYVQKEKKPVGDGPFPFLKRGSRKEPTALNRNPKSAEKQILSSPPTEENVKNNTVRSNSRGKGTNDNYWGLDEMEQPVSKSNLHSTSHSASFAQRQQETKSNVQRPLSTAYQSKPSKKYHEEEEDDNEAEAERYHDPYEESETLEEIIKHTTANRRSLYQQDPEQDRGNYDEDSDANGYEKPLPARIDAPLSRSTAPSVPHVFQQAQQSRTMTPSNRVSRTSSVPTHDRNNDEKVESAVRPVSTLKKEIRSTTPSNRNRKAPANTRNNGQSMETSQSLLEEKMIELQKEIDIYK